MSALREITEVFPGNRKLRVKISLEDNAVDILCEDGVTRHVSDPVRIEDFNVPPEHLDAWFKILKSCDPSVTRHSIRSAAYLKAIWRMVAARA